MIILQIEHPVPNFDAWKKAFDSDPVNRKQSGVRRYRVLRPIDNPNYAMIELEFDSVNEAEGLLAAMREVWGRIQGTIMENPRVRIVRGGGEPGAVTRITTGQIPPTERREPTQYVETAIKGEGSGYCA